MVPRIVHKYYECHSIAEEGILHLVKNVSSGIKMPGFKSWFSNLLAVWPWADNLSVPICSSSVMWG